MSNKSWFYVISVITVGFLVSAVMALGPLPTLAQWIPFVPLAILATVSQFFEAEAPGRQSYYPHLAFFFAGLILLPPLLFILLVATPHLLEWTRKRRAGSDRLAAWYIQPFNVATHLIAGFAAHWVIVSLDPSGSLYLSAGAVFAVLLAALIYAAIDHVIIGLVLALARGIPPAESQIFTFQSLSADVVLLFVGYVGGVLWIINPLLALPALSPLFLIYRALSVPQLEKDAQTDEKTGLWNIRHWSRLYAAELERAQRFGRPLSLIMADLDLLRNVNNTYGHLAGDAVLAGIGQIIRECTRAYDIAGRFGGEEFAIVLPETTLEEAQVIAERIRQTVEQTGFEVSTSPQPIHATISLGITYFTQGTCSGDELIHEADVALYHAKLSGRNRTAVATHEPQSPENETSDLIPGKVGATLVAAISEPHVSPSVRGRPVLPAGRLPVVSGRFSGS